MTSKKKPKLLFEVPVEVESGAQSGWVYRSGHDIKPHPHAPEVSIGAASAATLALAMATIAQALVLGVTIASIPLAMGIRAVRSLARPSD